jgi:quercetin dioxygenase-like cupin family protein
MMSGKKANDGAALRVGNVAGMVEYQTGSIVSREIVRKKAGTVTLFAFDKGQGLSEHTTPFDALVHVIDGVAQVMVGGNQYLMKKGELIVLPATVPHALKAVEKFKMMLVMIKARS